MTTDTGEHPMTTYEPTTYTVTFVLPHVVLTSTVTVDGYLEDELIAEAAAELLASDGLDLSNATVQDYTVEVI